MSHYLKHLVMRSLGEARGLSPRPATRYESVRQNPVAKFPESTQERLFQDPSSWTSPIETEVSRFENVMERRGQTDESLPSESERELIMKRRQNQSGLFSEKSDEGAIIRKIPADPVRTLEVSQEEATELGLSVPRPNTVVSDRREASTTPIAQRSGVLPVVRNSAVQPATVKNHLPSVGPQEVSRDSLRPTLKDVSFQPVRGEMITPLTEAQTPVVQIRIGRIEVRAVEPLVPAPIKKLVEPPRSTMSLDQYLRRRSREA